MNIFVYSRVLTLRGNYSPLSQLLIRGFVVQSRSSKSSETPCLNILYFISYLLKIMFLKWNISKYLRETKGTFTSNISGQYRTPKCPLFYHPMSCEFLHITVHPVKLCWLAAAVMKLRLAACKPILIQRSLWRRAQRAGTGPYCAAKTRAGALLIWELGGD